MAKIEKLDWCSSLRKARDIVGPMHHPLLPREIGSEIGSALLGRSFYIFYTYCQAPEPLVANESPVHHIIVASQDIPLDSYHVPVVFPVIEGYFNSFNHSNW